ncbi:TonB-dependent siderophore receptor [Pseudomonas cremoricolorata]|uniref:TonB-dependent siderophore receptor n=1 Tax=Pseudomonas cremoricolorata TaxID=157783 RepID=UPI00040639FE|nr:TonB-dependent siderophore receptor [Pseudomonas cremoricolorata]
MNPPLRLRSLTLSMLCTLTPGVFSGALLLAPALASAAESRQPFDVAPGALNQALTQFGHQANLLISYPAQQAAGRRSPGLQGTYSVEQGLALLLAGSGLQAVRLGNGSYTLQEAVVSPAGAGGAIELGATSITGQGMGEATENSGTYKAGLTSVGSKTPTSIRETPQSVSVVTAQALKDRQITTLGQAMRATPGITVNNSNYRTPRYYSRGFEIKNLQVDGAASVDTNGGYSNHLYNMTEFDHVEVLRGSAGLFGGVGDPGGIINLVRKRPLDHYQLKFEASAGTWDNYRSEVDVTGPLAFDGALRGRLAASYTDRQYFMDGRASENPTIYGVLEADLSPDTMVTFGGRLEQVKETGTGDGLPFYTYGKKPNYSRSYWPTTGFSYSDHDSNELFVKLDHYLDDNWKFNTSLTRVWDDVESQGAFGYGTMDANAQGPYWSGSYQKAWSEQTVVDLNLSGKFELLGRQHELLIGADAQKIKSRWRAADGANGRFGSLWEPWVVTGVDKEFWRDYNPTNQKQYGLYSTLRLQLADPLKLIVGARASRYSYDQTYSKKNRETGVWAPDNIIDYRNGTKLVPFGGLVYELSNEWSAYGSYSEIYNPQAQYQSGPLPGAPLEPMVGKTYETGIKGELLDGALNVSAALFYGERENQAMLDRRYAQEMSLYGGSCCYLPRGKVVSKGLDLEATGELAPGWEITAGYTFNRNQTRSGDASFATVTPKHQAKLWSTYVLPGELSDWKVGGGVRAQSGYYVNTVVDYDGNTEITPTAVKLSQGGYALWDAMIEYKVDSHWSVALNGNNLLDRKYYDTLYYPAGGNYFGEPRNFMLSVRGMWD